MLENMDSLSVRASGLPAHQTAPASSDAPAELRRLSAEDADLVLRDAIRQQGDWGNSFDGAADRGPAPRLDVLVRDFIDGNGVAPDQASKLLARARAMQDQADARRREAAMKGLTRAVGQRFAGVSLENYRATLPEQRKVLQAAEDYAGSIHQHVTAGDGLVLFGAPGTGKTHLLCGTAKAAIDAGVSVVWTNGQDLFARFRAAIDGEGSESKLVREMSKPAVLVIDDVLPPSGSLTDYQATTLYRIVDSRYRDCRPTWVSMNVSDGTEAEKGMGAQVVDRLRHGALTLFCNWPSYRRGVT